MKWLPLTLLIFPILAFAQAGEFSVGEMTVAYDSMSETEVATLYYQGDDLIASKSDGVTIVYENWEVILEAHDTNGDANYEVIMSIGANDEVTQVTGDTADEYFAPEVKEFVTLISERDDGVVTPEDDLVGSLDSIKIPRYHNYSLYFFVLLVIGGVGFWWYKKKKLGN